MNDQQKFNAQADQVVAFISGILIGAVVVMSFSILLGGAA